MSSQWVFIYLSQTLIECDPFHVGIHQSAERISVKALQWFVPLCQNFPQNSPMLHTCILHSKEICGISNYNLLCFELCTFWSHSDCQVWLSRGCVDSHQWRQQQELWLVSLNEIRRSRKSEKLRSVKAAENKVYFFQFCEKYVLVTTRWTFPLDEFLTNQRSVYIWLGHRCCCASQATL